jgi:hypothetical protein
MNLEPEDKERLALCGRSMRAFCESFFPDMFFRTFSESLHGPIFDALDDDSAQQVLIIAPRGIGKSMLLEAWLAREILSGRCHFGVYSSRAEDQAVSHSENVKNLMTESPVVKKFFGALKPQNRADDFSKRKWMIQSDKYGLDSLVMPRGAFQKVRGARYKKYRIDRAVVDDIEEEDDALSMVQGADQGIRRRLKRWLLNSLMNSFDRGSDNWKAVVIGSLIDGKSVLADLAESKRWRVVRVSVCDSQYHSLWPEYLSDQKIAEMVEGYREMGMLDSFHREHMSEAVSDEDSSFRQEWFRSYDEADHEFTPAQGIVLVDPAKTVKMHSDFSAMVGVGLDRAAGRIYVRDVDAGRYHPDDVYKRSVEMCRRLGCRKIGLEVTSLNEFITAPFQNYLKTEAPGIRLEELKARGSKDDRIRSLASPYRLGQIFHNRSVTAQLEAQLCAWPFGRHDDIPDALAYVNSFIKLNNRFFTAAGDGAPGRVAPTEAARLDNMLRDERPLEEYLGKIARMTRRGRALAAA